MIYASLLIGAAMWLGWNIVLGLATITDIVRGRRRRRDRRVLNDVFAEYGITYRVQA
jgi:hypothetical protein